eukprot:Tbor_TRINITY_DN4689_c0_g1::TRINITY_DN4689_c0_g1_i1::g.14964::m.14964/K03028/PSMD2, RPN1; 26S proteasome regulatory subunit N1
MTQDDKNTKIGANEKDITKKKTDKTTAVNGGMSDEDLRIQEEVTMLVNRCCEHNTVEGGGEPGLVAAALKMLSEMLRTATGSVGSVPKPLKFVRPLYDRLEEELQYCDKSNRMAFCDLLSFIAMSIDFRNKGDGDNSATKTGQKDEKENFRKRVCLQHKLNGNTDNLKEWGHEYLRCLAGEIAAEWTSRLEAAAASTEDGDDDNIVKEAQLDDLKHLADQIMTYMIKHQDEPAACDLAMETENTNLIINYCDEENYVRVAYYILSVAPYLPMPDNTEAYTAAYNIYVKFKALTAAIRVALLLQDDDKIKELFANKEAPLPIRLQMALICARHRTHVDHSSYGLENEEEIEMLDQINGNDRLSEFYLHSAKELDSLTPKGYEDIYKNHLVDQRLQPSTSNSHIHNLANTFVNGLVNAGYGKDLLLSPGSVSSEGDQKDVKAKEADSSYIYQTKDHRRMSATASLGLIHLWDHGEGLAAVDRFSYSEDPYIQAGAFLATGIVMTGVKSPFDPALALLSEKSTDSHREIRIGAVMGLGFAYAGTKNEEVKNVLMPLVADCDQPTEVQSMSSFALSLVFPGSCDEDISEAIISCLLEKTNQQLIEDPSVRYMILGLGSLFLGQQDKAETLLEATQALPIVIQRFAELTVLGCAYAASGNVMQIQKMFAVVAEMDDDNDDEEEKKPVDVSGEGDDNTGTEAETKYPVLNYKAAAVIAIGLIAMGGEKIGGELAKRSLIHILMMDHLTKDKRADPTMDDGSKVPEPAVTGRLAVPLAYALLSLSTPEMPVVETLHKLTHDADVPTAMSAILGMGLVAAGSNNARVATMLRNLSGYYHKDKDSSSLYMVRLSQGLTAMGKGHLTLSPTHSEGLLVSPCGLVGVLGLVHSALDINRTLLDRYHYMFYSICPAINPRMLLTLELQPQGDSMPKLVPVRSQVRVGMPVDTVTVPGNPKRITGFQTQTTPLLMSVSDERAEVISGLYGGIATAPDRYGSDMSNNNKGKVAAAPVVKRYRTIAPHHTLVVEGLVIVEERKVDDEEN